MNITEAMSWINNLHKRKIRLFDKDGNEKRTSIKCFVPMQAISKGGSGPVEDVEIITNRDRNHYFSVKLFLEGKSWAKDIHFYGHEDKRLTKGPAISGWKKEQMQEHHYIETALILRKLWAAGI